MTPQASTTNTARLPWRGRAGLWWWLLLAVGVARLVERARDLYRIESYDDFGLLPAHGAMLSDEYHVMGVGYPIKGQLTGPLDAAVVFDHVYVVALLVLGVLFLLVVAVPFRRRRPWAWWACWVVVAADAADAALFGPYEVGVLASSVLTAALVTVILLEFRPAFRPRVPASRSERSQG